MSNALNEYASDILDNPLIRIGGLILAFAIVAKAIDYVDSYDPNAEKEKTGQTFVGEVPDYKSGEKETTILIDGEPFKLSHE